MNLEEAIIGILVGVIGAWFARQTNADGSKDVDPNAEAIKGSITNIINVTNMVPDSALKDAGSASATRLGSLVHVASPAAVADAVKTAERYLAIVASEKASRIPTKDDLVNERPLSPADVTSGLSGIGVNKDEVAKVLNYSDETAGPTILPAYFVENSVTQPGSLNVQAIRQLRKTTYRGDHWWYSRVWLSYISTAAVYVHFFVPVNIPGVGEGLGYNATEQMSIETTTKNVYFSIVSNTKQRNVRLDAAYNGKLVLLFAADPYDKEDTVRLTEYAKQYGVHVPIPAKNSNSMMIFEYDRALIPPNANPNGDGWNYIKG